jgi:hypothetical protein
MPCRGWVPVALACVVLVAACSDDTGDDAQSSDSGTPSTTDAGDGLCAWATRADDETLNIAYPDAAATYWGLAYDLAPGETLELHGSFPAARYASFITYHPTGGAIDVLTDRDIEPDPGSENPFAGGDPLADRDYTVVLRADGDDGPNVILAGDEGAPSSSTLPADGGTATTAPPVTLPPDLEPAHVLGSGGDDGLKGSILYRVYVPEDAADPTGGAGLPEVAVVDPDGKARPVPTCAAPGPNPVGEALVEAYGPATDRPAPATPVFVRPAAGAARLFPNPDNVYIASIAAYEPGRIVVIRGTAPTFADPPGGRPIGSGEQVRYWSLCTNEYRKPYPVSHCVLDRDVVLDDGGRYTIVVSTPDDRPPNATAEEGVTWLDWGSTDVDNLLLLRHMLADPGFDESAINVEPGTLASTTMGDYAPVGTYCESSAFASGGAAACSG